MAEKRKIRLRYFTYSGEVDVPGVGRVATTLIARRGEEVELEPADVERGERFGAFEGQAGPSASEAQGVPVERVVPDALRVAELDGEEAGEDLATASEPDDGPDFIALEDEGRDGGVVANELASQDRVSGDYESHPATALQREADARELEVEGTGAGGNVKKADLVAALEADDRGE